MQAVTGNKEYNYDTLDLGLYRQQPLELGEIRVYHQLKYHDITKHPICTETFF